VSAPTLPAKLRGIIGGLSLLLIRGLLLWLVVPLGLVLWLLLWPLLRARRVRLGQFLGWMDLNLVALLQHSLLRPLFVSRAPWIPASGLPSVSHRIGFLDPV
jgi:hypothetical protein